MAREFASIVTMSSTDLFTMHEQLECDIEQVPYSGQY